MIHPIANQFMNALKELIEHVKDLEKKINILEGKIEILESNINNKPGTETQKTMD